MNISSDLENFQPHVLGLDLSGSRRDIEARLLPYPEYYDIVRQQFPTASEFDIERSILRKWPQSEIGKPGKFGTYWREHLLRYIKLLIPSTVITPSFMDEVFALEQTFLHKREIVNFIGNKSAGKTSFLARIALALVSIDPEYTAAYVAAPYKNVADYTVWSEVDSCYREIEEKHGEAFPGIRSLPSSHTFFFSEIHPKAGKIKLIGLDQTAKFQGSKSRDPLRGFFILIADEIGVFPSNAFVEIIGNVTANKNFIGLTGCNFKSMLGMDGILCDPAGREYQDLDMEKDHIWLSNYNSLTLRLDGHLSPNVLANREIYSFLLSETKRASMEDTHGLRGPKYLEQVRSFPNTSSGEQFVLTLDQIRAGGAKDKFWNRASGQLWTKVSFCDPGWEGDPCKIGAFEFGKAMVQAHDGTMHAIDIFRPSGPIETIKIQSGIQVTPEILEKITRFSKGPIMTKEGRDFSMDLQIALGCAEFNARHGIPSSHFGFDSSMRGGVVQEMVTLLGPEIMAYDTANKPSTMVMDGHGMMASDKYRNLRSELFFTLATIITSGQFRDADFVMDALAQICRHKVVRAGTKEAVESKADYKKANQNKSPDAADVLVGAAHVARRKGFQLAMNKKQAASMFSPAAQIELSGIRPRPSCRRLSYK